MTTNMSTCVFCEIVSEVKESAMVYNDSRYLAFMDRHPINEGHLLVIPSKHYQTVFEMPSKEVGELFEVVADLAKAVKNVTKAHGLNIGQNNGEIARQVVPHVHVHIIPRYPNDATEGFWPARRHATLPELRSVAKSIRMEMEGMKSGSV